MSDTTARREASPEAEEMMAFILRLRSRGLRDQRVLNALSSLPRPIFVLREHADLAWEDHALPIQCGQSITPPVLVATLAQRLDVEPHHRLLEIGTGSGYLTAVLARLSRRVFTVDRWRTLITEAEERLRKVEILNVTMMVADGRLGWPSHAPFDRIVATCAFESRPDDLLAQLAPQGRALLPIGRAGEEQRLVLVERGESGFAETAIAPIRTAMAASDIARQL
jgi:protein-L-isoaspartate(D-aspartate) O-methyltransferase